MTARDLPRGATRAHAGSDRPAGAAADAPRLDVEGPAAPPRRNGELVFAAPWESRLFGVTMALCESGTLAWEDFRRALIAEIAAWEAAGHPAEEWSYYERWQEALTRVLTARGLCDAAEIARRAGTLATRPPGHDHR